jgi:putative transcriptional regulator
MSPAPKDHGIRVTLDAVMRERGIGVQELADKVGITSANLSALKNDRALAVRFSTLGAICAVLECQPGDILTFSSVGSEITSEEVEIS